jgi:O-antigen ligase
MPPNVALALCLILIISFLTIDRRRNEKSSSARWIPLIWVMIGLSRFVSQWLNLFGHVVEVDRETAYYEGSPVDRVVFSCLILIGLIIIMRRKIVWSKLLREYGWLFGYFLYCGISILWSDFPYISLKRWTKEFGDFIIVLIIATETNPYETTQWIFRKCGYILVPLSVLFIKYYPQIGRGYTPRGGEAMYYGASFGKNGLGLLCLICGFFFVIEVLRWWREKNVGFDKKQKLSTIIILCMNFWLLMMSRSVTAIICLIVGIIVMVSLGSRTIREVVKKPIALGICGALIVVTLMTTDAFKFGVDMIGREGTLTGRTEIWEKTLSVKINPLIGAGYESFWFGDVSKKWGDYWSAPNQSHNGYLEIYLNLGIVGLAFVGGIFVSYAKKAIRGIGPNLYSGRVQLSFLLIFMLYNITEYGFRPISSIWLVFLLLWILCLLKSKISETTHLNMGREEFSN